MRGSQHVHEDGRQIRSQRTKLRQRARTGALVVFALVAAALPLVGLVSLLLQSQLDPHVENYRLHFVVFGAVGAVAFGLGYAAGEAANRRADARVLLLSLAFMATGGFLLLHALGTPGILFAQEHAGFQVAIPVGLLVSAAFAAGSAFVDVRPEIAAVLIRRRTLLRLAVLASMGAWSVWTVASLPPLGGPDSEAATNRLLTLIAVLGTIMYAVSAARYWSIFRHSRNLLPAAVVACFVLLSEALIGVAVTGERKWHASWWEWHGLIVTAYLVVGLAARREWRDERFRRLYLSTTRERHQDGASSLPISWASRASPSAHRQPRLQPCWMPIGASPRPHHTSVRRRSREVRRRRHHGHVQQQRRPARPRAAGGVRRSRTATRGCPPGRGTSRVASHACWRQQRRGDGSRDRKRRPHRVRLCGRHGQYRRSSRAPGSYRRSADRFQDISATARWSSCRGTGWTANEGEGRRGRCLRVARTSLLARGRGAAWFDAEVSSELVFSLVGDDEAASLAEWLAAETWPFHSRPRLTPEDARGQIRAGDFTGSNPTYWVDLAGQAVSASSATATSRT